MRTEKQYLVEEVSSHLNKSDYVYLVNFEGITVDEIADKEKIELKVGVLNEKILDRTQIETLAKLPGLETLRAQLLSLFSQPATSLVRVFNAVPQSTLNVLQAKARAENGS